MGLTMGIMEAYAENEDDVLEGHARRAHAILRSGLSYSPSMGVKGTPPPPLAFPEHTPVVHTCANIQNNPYSELDQQNLPTHTDPVLNATCDLTVGPESTKETSISKESPAGGGRRSGG
jgi:hypothetical protein